ncbi:hypothetical protein JCM18237_12260 [Halorubrum luteum]
MFEFSLVAGLLLGPAVGFAATLAMDVVMTQLPEGETPPRVAAGVLTDTPVASAPERLATVVHYVAGAGSGLLLLWLLAAFDSVTGALGEGAVATAVTVGLAGSVMLVLMIGFFAIVPLPRARGLRRQRLSRIRTDWSIMATTYVIVASTLFLAAGAIV